VCLGGCGELGNPQRERIGGELSDDGWSTSTEVDVLTVGALSSRLEELPSESVVWVDGPSRDDTSLALLDLRVNTPALPAGRSRHLVCEVELEGGLQIERRIRWPAEQGQGFVLLALPRHPKRIVTRVED